MNTSENQTINHGDEIKCTVPNCQSKEHSFVYCSYCDDAFLRNEYDNGGHQNHHCTMKRKRQFEMADTGNQETKRRKDSDGSASTTNHSATTTERSPSVKLESPISSTSHNSISNNNFPPSHVEQQQRRAEEEANNQEALLSDQPGRTNLWVRLLNCRPIRHNKEALAQWLTLLETCSDPEISVEQAERFVNRFREDYNLSTESSSSSDEATRNQSDGNSSSANQERERTANHSSSFQSSSDTADNSARKGEQGIRKKQAEQSPVPHHASDAPLPANGGLRWHVSLGNAEETDRNCDR